MAQKQNILKHVPENKAPTSSIKDGIELASRQGLDMSILLTSSLSGQPDQTNSVKIYLVSASQMARVMEAFGDQGKYQANLNARIFHQNFQRSRLDSEPGPKMLQNLD